MGEVKMKTIKFEVYGEIYIAKYVKEDGWYIAWRDNPEGGGLNAQERTLRELRESLIDGMKDIMQNDREATGQMSADYPATV